MAEDPKVEPKADAQANLAMAALGVVKDLIIAFVMALLERAQIKQAVAEDHAAVAETKAAVAVGIAAIEKEQNAKDSAKVIDDFLTGK